MRKGTHQTKESKLKISQNNAKYYLGKSRKPETILKISKTLLGHICFWKGKKRSTETKKKMSKHSKLRTLSKKVRREMGARRKGFKHSNKIKRLITKKAREHWQDPGYVKKIMQKITPNKQELKLNSLLEKLLPREYKFVGDGQFILAGKCPDFVNINGQKKLIELYGDYWHRYDNPQDRIDLFAKYGWDTLIVWEHELEGKGILKEKLVKFNKQ